MPLTIEENLIGQQWSMGEVSRLNTSGGEGVEIIKNEIFNTPDYYHPSNCHEYLPDININTDLNSKDEKSQKKLTSSKSFNTIKNVFIKRNSSCNDFKQAENGHIKEEETIVNTNNSIKVSGTGQYTYKIYRIASKFPWYIQKILPKESLSLHEKSWNLYPVIKTSIRNEYMKDKFHIRISTITKESINGEMEENVHNLTQEELDRREIIIIDIAEPVSQSEYVESEDPTKFKSKLTSRGPLEKNWIKTQKPLICCYKLVDLEFVWFGLQTKAEQGMVNMYKKIFKKFHREIFCWMDKWYDKSIDDIRKDESDLQKTLVEQINKGEVSANRFEDEE